MAKPLHWYRKVDWGRPPVSRDDVVIYGEPPAEIVCPRRSLAFTHSGLMAVGRCDERAPTKSPRAVTGEGCGANCPARAALVDLRQRVSAGVQATPSPTRALMNERLLAVLSNHTTGLTGPAVVAAVRQQFPDATFGDESLRAALAKLVDDEIVALHWPRGLEWRGGPRYRLATSGLSLVAGGAR